MVNSRILSLSAMRRSFVATDFPSLGTVGVASRRATICGLLSSSGVTRLHRYYETIRLPAHLLPSSLFGCYGILPLRKGCTGPPGLPRNHIVTHAMVSDPEEVNIPLPLTVMFILTSDIFHRVVLPIASLTGLNPFCLAAYGLYARCPTLKTACCHAVSKDSLPGGWPAFRGGIHTRLITRPCPAAQKT